MQQFNSFLDRLRQYFNLMQETDKNIKPPTWFNDYNVLSDVEAVKQRILEIYATAPDCRIRSLTKEMLDFISVFQKCWYVRDKKYVDFKVESAVREEGVLKRLDDKQKTLSDNIKD